ncbi:MAG: phosphoglycerate kinase [Bacilli bacterium]|nr:phosphoglycerate kinase [Bacilli bacterium]
MKCVKEIDVKNKKVILRCDLNVPLKNNNIISDEKIIASLKTIKYLINQKAKIILMSHLGKIKSSDDLKTKSLLPIYNYLKKLLPDINIYFSAKTRGADLEALVKNLKETEIVLIENTRFEDLDNKKESNNDYELAKYWASLGDVFINDAFGLTHRKHSSNNRIKEFLPSGYGFLIEEELSKLDLLLKPNRPFTVLMGGAKVEDKSLLIKNILKECDFLLLGGGIANTFLAVNNEVGESLISFEYINEAKKLLLKYPNKIIMPTDVVVINNNFISIKEIKKLNNKDKILDLGPKSIELFKRYLEKSETVFINGTVGLYEDERFSFGTKSILEISSSINGQTILGGGDAVASSKYFNINNFYHLSTGGGATLEYIATKKLKCMESGNVNNS